jgi:DNA-binding response OmpR family regulator
VVEDELDLREALRDKLNFVGFSVIEAIDGEQGLEVALREHPDLILLDIIMPKMDGLVMLKRLREDPWGKNSNVIMLTNLSDAKSVSSALEQGTYDYFVKSDWKIEDVVAKIQQRLNVAK